MAWHPQAITLRQRRVLAELGPLLTKQGFYLAGGTAVALHLGHRRSVDLDWFNPEFPDPAGLAEEIREHGIRFVTEQIATGTLHGTVRGVRVSLIRYRYPMLADVRSWPGGIHIAARADLAAMKLLAIAQRGSKKDFVDLFALGKRANSLQRMLTWYRDKYSVNDTAHLLCSLVYFADADPDRLPRMLWDVDWRTIKNTLRRWVQKVPR
jgi:hypothetical protein